jgi:hypothetical protein
MVLFFSFLALSGQIVALVLLLSPGNCFCSRGILRYPQCFPFLDALASIYLPRTLVKVVRILTFDIYTRFALCKRLTQGACTQ